MNPAANAPPKPAVVTTACPHCGAPLTHTYPGAVVWHAACLMVATEHLRKSV